MRIHGRRDVFPIIDGTDISRIAGTRARARARRQRLGAVVERRRVRPTASARDVGRDADRPRRRDDARVRSRSRTATMRRHRATARSGTQTTTQLLPWAFMAGANVDVTPHLEIGAEAALLAVSPVQEAAHRRRRHLPRPRARDEKNYNDSWQVSGGVRVHDLAAAPSLELMARHALRSHAGAVETRHARSADRSAHRVALRRALHRRPLSVRRELPPLLVLDPDGHRFDHVAAVELSRARREPHLHALGRSEPVTMGAS